MPVAHSKERQSTYLCAFLNDPHGNLAFLIAAVCLMDIKVVSTGKMAQALQGSQ